ncbi:hypothetical protein [uncultured Amnibacterium sp.]|uniref:hypothetical protein n=1 Tax=uncultured Amnibacterium sp. TaxID=1631851 RepID=UPI0035CAA348
MTEPILFRRSDLTALGVARPDRDGTAGMNRVRRGVYAPPGSIGAALDERYLRLVHASSRTLTGDTIYSLESAAAALCVPILGAWPTKVHLIAERRSGGRSQLDVVRHCIGLEHVSTVVVDGLVVTSPARTAFDFALSRPFADAVVVMDAVLRLYPESANEIAALAEAYGTRRGHARLRRVIAFADGRSGSIGESWSRLEMDRLGFAEPDLQVKVTTDERDEFGDFGWRVHRILGEFDGEVKYRSDRYRMGGSVEDVVIREKNRENRMRVAYPSIGRWDWADLRAGRLERTLVRAGVPRVRAVRPPAAYSAR